MELLQRPRTTGKLTYCLKLAWSFVYPTEISSTGLSSVYLIQHYLLLLSTSSLLVSYVVSGCYSFLVPTANNELRVLFNPAWSVIVQQVNTNCIWISIAL